MFKNARNFDSSNNEMFCEYSQRIWNERKGLIFEK